MQFCQTMFLRLGLVISQRKLQINRNKQTISFDPVASVVSVSVIKDACAILTREFNEKLRFAFCRHRRHLHRCKRSSLLATFRDSVSKKPLFLSNHIIKSDLQSTHRNSSVKYTPRIAYCIAKYMEIDSLRSFSAHLNKINVDVFLSRYSCSRI